MQGVFLPCLQNMLNIIFFIRLPWIIGVSGVGLTLAYLGVAMACTLTTAMSIGAIISNGVNAGGGAYYLVSRTLGPELGGSVGILFYISTSIAVAVSIIGATEVLLVRQITESLCDGSLTK
ncbi:hypothetical protein BC828DRAFT_40082 [Blastocladiella britannica]|nr:hypothetical protein BC828DRAFT_40082 [Blastocladiella britannica]